MERKYTSLHDFYYYYLTEHANKTCRTLHFIGTMLVIVLTIAALVTQQWYIMWFLPLAGYGFAWVGHFVFEKNKPATFQYPLYSFASDFIMFGHIISGKIDKKLMEAHERVKK